MIQSSLRSPARACAFPISRFGTEYTSRTLPTHSVSYFALINPLSYSPSGPAQPKPSELIFLSPSSCAYPNPQVESRSHTQCLDLLWEAVPTKDSSLGQDTYLVWQPSLLCSQRNTTNQKVPMPRSHFKNTAGWAGYIACVTTQPVVSTTEHN